MAEYLTPGQYLEETKEAPVVQSVSTATGAFVGVTEKGRFGSFLVTSFKKFQEEYGGYIADSYLAYAVKGFFDNGGSRAYISRVVHYSTGAPTSAKATVNIVVGEDSDVVATIDALTDGEWGNALKVEIDNWESVGKTFDLIVKLNNVQVGAPYVGLTLATAEDVVNALDGNIRITVLDEDATLTDGPLQLAGGDDGLDNIAAADYIGDEAAKTGLHAFDNDIINLVAIPGVTDTAVVAGLDAYCENRRVNTIFETPLGKTPTTARTYRVTDTNKTNGRMNLYYPWVEVSDPIGVGKSPKKLIPPSGHIMGIYARTDAARGVFKAAAGETDGRIVGVTGLEYNVNDDEQGLLNPVGVNVIRSFPGSGIVLWGARTQAPAGDVFMYTPVRRAVDYIEDSIMSSTRWTTFEINDEKLWGKIKSSVESFLRGFWRSGGLKGTSESEAFTVVCDSTTTTEDDIAAGRVFCDIGVATQKPGEFIIFRLQVR